MQTSVKSNGSLAKEDKFKKLLKEACKRDKNLSSNELEVMGSWWFKAGTNTVVQLVVGRAEDPHPPHYHLINEEKISRSKRKKQKSSQINFTSNHPRSTPPTPTEIDDRMEEFIDIPNAKTFYRKEKMIMEQRWSRNSSTWHQSSVTAPR
ncbi:hypothetical protein CVS40_8780 [Lucilia cuprina]|nr:hypothetical protein CVS40_8780 [Lucilia cuprina]